jgi:tripartite-type tricarboxylate transporter receptor subunit TctC
MPYLLGRREFIASSLAVLGSNVPAYSQGYPSKTVTIVVPLAAGTGMDSLVRIYADKLSAVLGKPIVVENKPGASLMLAAIAVSQAEPDGHTLLISTSSAMAINLALFKQFAYNAEKDFVPVSFYVKSPFILIVNPKLPANTVPELIKYVKETKTPLNYSSPGPGSAQHLSMEFMKQQFGLEITHVPYRNTGQSITDIVAGHVQLRGRPQRL